MEGKKLAAPCIQGVEAVPHSPITGQLALPGAFQITIEHSALHHQERTALPHLYFILRNVQVISDGVFFLPIKIIGIQDHLTEGRGVGQKITLRRHQQMGYWLSQWQGKQLSGGKIVLSQKFFVALGFAAPGVEKQQPVPDVVIEHPVLHQETCFQTGAGEGLILALPGVQVQKGEEGIALFREAIEPDPLFPGSHMGQGFGGTRFFQGKELKILSLFQQNLPAKTTFLRQIIHIDLALRDGLGKYQAAGVIGHFFQSFSFFLGAETLVDSVGGDAFAFLVPFSLLQGVKVGAGLRFADILVGKAGIQIAASGQRRMVEKAHKVKTPQKDTAQNNQKSQKDGRDPFPFDLHTEHLLSYKTKGIL